MLAAAAAEEEAMLGEKARQHRCRRGPEGDFEHFVEVGGGVGADNQDPLARRGQRQAGGAGKAGLADAALAGEKKVTRIDCGLGHGGGPQQQPEPGAQPPLTGMRMRGLSALATSPSFAASWARLG